MKDFKRLLEEAHNRGIRIIIDLVLNHTSSDHPFFVEASKSESWPYHDWYVWSAENGGAHWHLANTGPNSKYFYGYFSPSMPDLNYRNPEVTDQMEKVTAFWLEDVGVDGFRVDAAKHLIEDGKVLENTQATHDWFKEFYTFYKTINPDTYVVGEVSGSDARVSELYDDDEMDMIFNFEVASGFVNSANGGSISGVGSAVTFIEKDNPDWNFATFLTNHDQNRVMSTLGGNVDKAKVAAALMLTSPGTPFIYYGEEIGMEGIKPDEYIRRPMQWDNSNSAGFTTGDPWEVFGSNIATANVNIQSDDKNSLLSWYRQLIQFRKDYPVFSTGGYTEIKCSDRGIYAALRESEEETILVLINMSKNPVADFTLTFEGASLPDGRYNGEPILGDAIITGMNVSSGKSINYKPGVSMDPYQTILLKLVSVE
jgi:glycosidase